MLPAFSLCVHSSAVEPPIELDEISVLRVQGRALWVGTRAGFILILDREKVEKGEPPLLGLQKCGEGRVSDICPLSADMQHTARMRVMCSLEHCNETSGLVMIWEYHPRLDGVRLANMKRLSSHQSMSSSSDGPDKHTATAAKVHANASKAERWAGGVAFEGSHSDQADDLAGQTGGNHGDNTKPVDDTTTSLAGGENDAIVGCRDDAVTLTGTVNHGYVTGELGKEDALTQPPSKAEPRNAFTSSSQRAPTVGNDVVPVVETNKHSSGTGSSMEVASLSAEPSDLATSKSQPLLPLLELGETSLLSCSSNCSGSGPEERAVPGGREEGHSLGSWEVVPDPPVPPPGGGACTEQSKHDATDKEGATTLSADDSTLIDLTVDGSTLIDLAVDGSTLIDLAVGGTQGGQTNDPASCPPHQEPPKPGGTAVINEVGESNVESDSSDQPDHPSVTS